MVGAPCGDSANSIRALAGPSGRVLVTSVSERATGYFPVRTPDTTGPNGNSEGSGTKTRLGYVILKNGKAESKRRTLFVISGLVSESHIYASVETLLRDVERIALNPAE